MNKSEKNIEDKFYIDIVSRILEILSGRGRLEVFLTISEEKGIAIDEIANKVDVPRSSIYKFIRDFSDESMIKNQGGNYYLTELGIKISEKIRELSNEIIPLKYEIDIQRIRDESKTRFGSPIGDEVEKFLREKVKELKNK